MRSELSDLLERGAEHPSAEPDFADLARRGRRRRHTQRATSALAVLAVIALTAGVVMPRLRQPDIVFDSGPRGGVGTWEAVPPAPIEPRRDAVTASDGRRVVVFGGTALEDTRGDVPLHDGAVYDTSANAWTAISPLPTDNAPDGASRPSHTELLDDGRLLLVYDAPAVVAFYDFGSRTWKKAAADVRGVDVEFAAWTGSQAIFWGASRDDRMLTLVYTDDVGWRSGRPGPLSGRTWAASAWTGDRLLVWGGGTGSAVNGEIERVFDDGAAYDPATDSWTPLAASPLAPRQGADSIWTGKEWVVIGGHGATSVIEDAEEPTVREIPPTESCDAFGRCSASAGVVAEAEPQFVAEYFTDGARYDPATDAWSLITRPPKGFRALAGVAYGEAISYGKDGYAEYDVRSDTWSTRPAPTVDAHISAWDAVGVDGRIVLLNSGPMVSMADTDRPRRLGGVVYDADEGRWDALAEAATAQRYGAAIAPVGDGVFVWGGSSVTRDISQGYQGGNPWHHHDDGAVLTLE